MDTTTKPAVKLCINCKHCHAVPCGDISAAYYECKAKEPDVNVVTGDEKYAYCSVARHTYCQGNWYIQKEPVVKQEKGTFSKIITWISDKF